MEQKCLKTNVFTNEILFCESLEQAIDIDFSLPDFCPDISKIFKCQAVPRISAKSLEGKNIKIDGVVNITLIYAESEGKLCSFEYQFPFEKNIEANKDISGANLNCCIKMEYINCRAVTGRKVDIHGAAGILVKAFRRKSSEIISDYDDGNIEVKRGIVPATIPMGYAEKYLILEEEIGIGQGQPNIRSILRCSCSSVVKETKIINDKAVVKGEMGVNILYFSDEDESLQSVKTVIPFSQIIDIEGITEECECETRSDVCFFEVKPRMSSVGDNRSFSVIGKILLTSKAFCGNDVAVILDAFSRKYSADIKKDKVCFEKITNNIRETFNCKKNIKLDFEISSLIDLWSNIQNINTCFENDEIKINGCLSVGMIVSTKNLDSVFIEKLIDFEYKYTIGQNVSTKHCEPQIDVVSCGYTITSADSIELRPELCINAAIYEKNEVSLISELTVNENDINVKKGKGAMTIYFPCCDECVWDVARIYNASVEEIMKINELETEKLEPGKMILVPIL